MIDLSKQKTFFQYESGIEKYYDSLFQFCLERLDNGVWILQFHSEVYGSLEFIAIIDSLEDLEYYYNNSTNHQIFEWK